jgi:hypothetical protein
MNLTLILIIGFIGLIVLFVFIDETYYDGESNFLAPTAVVSCIIYTVLSIFIWHYYFDETEEIHEHEYWIHSLGNDKYLEGEFTLGSGSIEEIDYYFYYINTSKGFKRCKTRVDKSFIIETNDVKPHIETVVIHYKDEEKFFKTIDGTTNHRVIYVPKGTIIKEFKVR